MGIFTKKPVPKVAQPKEDVIVGIDFGMTGTAVCYARPQDAVGQYSFVDEWYDGDLCIRAKKVPTRVWRSKSEKRPCVWGFERPDTSSSRENEKFELVHMFKTRLQDTDPGAKAIAKTCTVYFLKELRFFVEKHLREKNYLKKGGHARYVFSYPTTWETKDAIGDFQKLIKAAGFSPNTYSLTLNEAKASLAYFHNTDQTHVMDQGKMVMVADIGGATSDVCIARIGSTSRDPIKNLTIASPSAGKLIGGTEIDHWFKKKLKVYLAGEYGRRKPSVDKNAVDAAIRRQLGVLEINPSSEYISFKYGFMGSGTSGKLTKRSTLPLLIRLEFNGFRGDSRDMDIRVPAEKRNKWFQEIFGDQIKKLLAQFQREVKSIESGEVIQHVVLTGGMSSSRYVRRELRKKITGIPSLRNATISTSGSDGELAVSIGLVTNELATLRDQYNWKYIAPLTYGIRDHEGDFSALFQKGEEVTIGSVKRLNLSIYFDTEGNPSRSMELVSSESRSPPAISRRASLLPRSQRRDEWVRNMEKVRDLQEAVKNSSWTHSEATKKPRTAPYKGKAWLHVQFYHSGLSFSISETEKGEAVLVVTHDGKWLPGPDEDNQAPPRSEWWSVTMLKQNIDSLGAALTTAVTTVAAAVGIYQTVSNIVSDSRSPPPDTSQTQTPQGAGGPEADHTVQPSGRSNDEELSATDALANAGSAIEVAEVVNAETLAGDDIEEDDDEAGPSGVYPAAEETEEDLDVRGEYSALTIGADDDDIYDVDRMDENYDEEEVEDMDNALGEEENEDQDDFEDAESNDFEGIEETEDHHLGEGQYDDEVSMASADELLETEPEISRGRGV